MRIALFAAVFAILVAGRGALAEDLSGKLAELESGAAPASGKVQIVPGLELPQQTPGVQPEPEAAGAAAPAPAPELEPSDDEAEAAEDPGEIGGESVNGGFGVTVEPRVPNTTDP